MRRRQLVLAAAAAMALLIGSGAGLASAQAGTRTADPGAALPAACQPGTGTPKQISTAKLIIEYNAKNQDFGVHGAFDDTSWKELCVKDPTGKPVLVVEPKNALGALTMAGIFFESREPPVADYSFEKLKKDFPVGDYVVRGTTFEGKELFGAAKFTHDVPAAPVIRSPRLAAEAEQILAPVRRNVVVKWEEVDKTIDGRAVNITGYQVIVTKVATDDPNGFSRPMYDVHVPAGVHSLTVPPEFFERNTTYELEVLALEVSGNQTISLGFFKTR